MNSAQLIEKVATELDLPKITAKRFVQTLGRIVSDELSNPGNDVTLVNLGKFKSVLTKQRNGRNPATGEPITVAPRVAIKFKATSSSKE